MATEPPAPHAVLATPEAKHHLDRLPEKILHAAFALIHGALTDDPRRVGTPLVGELEGLWSARRSDYRIAYEIDDEARTIIIHRVQHRRDIYRSR